MSSSSKTVAARTRLASLGRRRYVSISAMAELCTELREGGIPSNTSRASIKRARDEFLKLERPNKEWQLLYTHPIAMLVHAVQESAEFASVLGEALRKKPPTPSNPWHIILYADEITPGDPLK
eukprot:9375326-Karenia_brevis.AAC.1